ncbi:MAG: hypothetical protein IKL52_04020, partial [Candidatus Gastranaerophilales bacterium]|nr:hypothetical protein [Candidatus Gastranaerophilales bacterium]
MFDFLMVKSDNSKYIAQIIEIYDDKFDASQNVAKIKLFYQINQNNEVMPYDNFTPNKECEIIKVKQEEIENFINQDKETFIFGTNTKSSTALNLQYDFFENNAVVLADKVENANCVTFNLAKNLSTKKNVVIIDQTGVLEYDEAKKIKAGKNFRMPLNYSTIDYVFNKCLADASLEFQAIGGEIISEIKRFAKKQENEFIPFNHLTRVLIQQYKATPYPELKLLLVRLKKYQMDEVFAKTKADKENLFKAIEKNPITILDLSSIEPFWQKAYLEYIISDVEKEIFLLARINDEHFDSDLINKIYSKKKNIKFVPNVSYNYKRLPSVMQHCKNYILMPSLFQRADFLDANFALSNLISQGCVVFGESTDNFLYLACDYELDVQAKRKNYKKIALTLVEQEQDAEQKLGQKGDYFENKAKEELSDDARLMQELSDLNASQKQGIIEEDYTETNETEEEFVDLEEKEEDFDEIENPLSQPNSQADEKTSEGQDLIFKSEEKQEVEDETSVRIDEVENDLVFKEEVAETQPEPTVVPVKKEIEKEEIDEIFKEEIVEEEQIDISDEELDFFQMAQESEDEYEDEEQEEVKEE